MHDHTSIITQVSKQNDEHQPLQHVTNELNSDEESGQSDRRKKRVLNRKLLASILCCFSAFSRRPRHELVEDGTLTLTANQRFLLPIQQNVSNKKICLVIDLDETLVHSSFKPMKKSDYVVPVEIDSIVHTVYVLKRPHVDQFLKRVGELFECILFTASVSKYAEPVSNLLDQWNVFDGKLYRESCVYNRGFYVKDLSRLGRNLRSTVILDNSPTSYAFHPENAIPIRSWFDDQNDCELLKLIPFFEAMSKVDGDVRDFLRSSIISNPTLDSSAPSVPLQAQPVEQQQQILQNTGAVDEAGQLVNVDGNQEYSNNATELDAEAVMHDLPIMRKGTIEGQDEDDSKLFINELDHAIASHHHEDDKQDVQENGIDVNKNNVHVLTVHSNESNSSVTRSGVTAVQANRINNETSSNQNGFNGHVNNNHNDWK